MKLSTSLKLRTSVILLLVSTILVTLAIVGSGILAVTIGRIHDESRLRVADAAADVASRVEAFLANVQARVELTGTAYRTAPPAALRALLDSARRPPLTAIYVIAGDGKLLAASIAGVSEERTRELAGIDLAGYPYFRAAIDSGETLWSDKHLSAVTGTVTVGLAAPIGNGDGVVIAELPLESVLDISRIADDSDRLDHWVIDRRGEIVADTGPVSAGRRNLYSHPLVAAARTGAMMTPSSASFGDTTYHVAAAVSRPLGWLFVSRMPAGLSNPDIREVVTIVLLGFFSSALVGLLLAPLWAQGIVRPLQAVAKRANQIARGERPAAWPTGSIVEFNRLSSDLGTMADAIAAREEDLRRLNDELEDRVVRRTDELNRSNEELSTALAIVRQAKDELIQSERLAALGRLVSGIAHELNTPLGNGRMAITTLGERLIRFEAALGDGLRRTELDDFVGSVRTSTLIADSNLKRASELIGSFKRVAADRAGSRRRRFQLREVVDEVLLTLSPTLAGQPIEIRVEVPDDLLMESYPGELGQAFTNILENAVLHAFPGRERGTVMIAAVADSPARVRIRLSDDGVGLSPEVARRAFDPFFTTKMGRGGTGLGLFIAHNAVTNVLGGTLGLSTEVGMGATFELLVPTVAPSPAAAAVDS